MYVLLKITLPLLNSIYIVFIYEIKIQIVNFFENKYIIYYQFLKSVCAYILHLEIFNILFDDASAIYFTCI